MKFSDNKSRDNLTETYVKRAESDMESREEANSNLWDIEIFNISKDKQTGTFVHLYKTPARDVRIGENIYDKKGNYLAYRSE